jgi:Domain of unknown function (DUF4280)
MTQKEHNALLEKKRAERKKKDEEDSPTEKRELVMDGAKLKCEYAQGLGTLKVTSNEILLQDKVIATVGDGNNMVNLQFQGTCGHPKWPAQNMSPPPCMSVIKLSPWQNPGTGFMQTQKVLVKESTITCTPDFNSAVAKPIPKVESIENKLKEETEIVYTNGHFYNEDGTFEGKVDNPAYTGTVNDVYTCTGKGKGKDKDGKEIEVFGGIKLLKDDKGNPVYIDTFKHLASTLYAEGSSTWEEAAGIFSVLKNRAVSDNTSTMEQANYNKGVYGASKEGLAKYSSKNVSESLKKNANKGVILGFRTSKDYSNGAYYWDGKDFLKGGGHIERYTPGYKFTNASHDLWGQGDNLKHGKNTFKMGKTKTIEKSWDYKYESTGVEGNTTFSKLTEEWSNAQHPTKKTNVYGKLN